MTTAVFTHPACLKHEPGDHHPESPERLRAILRRLEKPDFADLAWREAPPASDEQIARVHPPVHMALIREVMPRFGQAMLDADTILSPGSSEAANRAAGAVCAAVDAVMAGDVANAFCAVRPPGHHAEPDRAMGFCVFNNVAIGALHAHVAQSCARVAVLDFDVHHGNGTQKAFEHDARLFFGSSHQAPLYPGTGARSETGVGNIVNVPLPAGAGSRHFRRAWGEIILPALSEFMPDFVLISAGFDAHYADPLANLEVTEDDFAWVTAEILRIAKASCGGRVVSALEGGYDLEALADCAAAHVRELMT